MIYVIQSHLNAEKIHFSLYICVCVRVHVCMYMCMHTYTIMVLMVRGQPVRVGSLLLPCEPWGLNPACLSWQQARLVC